MENRANTTNKAGKQDGTPTNKNDVTFEQAKRAALDLLDDGTTYREAAKVEWLVAGKTGRFRSM